MDTLISRSRALGAWVAAAVGPDEIQFWLGLVLVSAGLWFVWKPGAALVPGGVLLWISLPSRTAFVMKVQAVEKPQRRRDA